MNINDPNIDQLLQSQGVNDFFHRLTIAIKSRPVYLVADEANISRSTIYQYINKTSYPDIVRLAAIAKNTGYSMSWILFGETQEKISVENNEYISCLTIPDDTMFPTLNIGSKIIYQKITLLPETPLLDGIYVLATIRGSIVRRLQWQEEKKEYLILCSNSYYPPQTIKNVNIIGKVTAIMTAI